MTQSSAACERGVIRAQPCPGERGRAIPAARKRWILAACILASSMAFIDGSALTVALPALRESFGADFATVQWVVNGYALTLASLTLIGGALADVYGKARMLMIGVIAFGVFSAACALAPTPAWLIAARAAQGAAAAIVAPASLALIGATYPRDERGAAIGVWAAASAITTAGGPILGGWLTETFGWQAVFWINPPIAVATLIVLLLFSQPVHREERGFDWLGAALIAGALAAIAFALSSIAPAQGAEDTGVEIGQAVWIGAIAGVIALIAYAFWETRAREPLTPPRLWANRTFTALNVATLLIYGGMAIMFFALPFELIDRRGLSATQTGLALLPVSIALGALSQIFGGLADKIGARPLLIIGPLVAAGAYLLLAALRGADSVWIAIVAPVTVMGLGLAVLVAPLTASVMSSIDDKDEGLAAGVNNAAARAAQLIGVALAAGLAQFAMGYHASMIAAAVASALGAACMLALPRKRAQA
jgi:EmrB/QacA subfamily drug resistance transporter